MLPFLILAITALVIWFLIKVDRQPIDFCITRTAIIPAPAATVFPLVNDLRQWPNWSPWAKLDPAMQQTYTGPAAGVGASYAWTGNSKVGAGRMTILASQPNKLVSIQLEFLRPFKANNLTQFTFKDEGANTFVAWRMTGENNFMARVFGLFMNMDKMVGRDFEKGLTQLKAAVQPAAKA